MLDVNVLALCICTQEAIKSMDKYNIDGHVVHINSILGHEVLTLPKTLPFSVYPATKFAVTALTETLRKELVQRESKIKVSVMANALLAKSKMVTYIFIL